MAETSTRTPRDLVSRDKSARLVYTPPNALPDPTPEPGYVYRWIATHVLGEAQNTNVSTKMREGWELVRKDEYPDFEAPTVESGKYEGVFGVGGLLLARIPEETVAERTAYFNQRSADQMQAVDQDMMRENAHSTMRISNADRQSRVTFGGPKR